MRINKFVALATGLSRRSVDLAIGSGRIRLNSQHAKLGGQVSDIDKVYLDNKQIFLPSRQTVLLLNKPIGYVSSRAGQGSKTIYELLPKDFQNLKPVGRLDKDSSGLLLLTDDGDLAYSLSHPKFSKIKVYQVRLNKPLKSEDTKKINAGRVLLDNKPSKMSVKTLSNAFELEVSLGEGRNRQIRRSFETLGYQVIKLERTAFGPYRLSDLGTKVWRVLDNSEIL